MISYAHAQLQLLSACLSLLRRLRPASYTLLRPVFLLIRGVFGREGIDRCDSFTDKPYDACACNVPNIDTDAATRRPGEG